VNLELNGVKYSGVLVANVPLSQGETRTSSPCHAEAPANEEEHDEEEPEQEGCGHCGGQDKKITPCAGLLNDDDVLAETGWEGIPIYIYTYISPYSTSNLLFFL